MSMPKVVILGAGISGLACAWYLRQRLGNRVDLTVLEQNPRCGGWIQTVRDQGFLFELGPRGCRPKGPGLVTLELAERLGLRGDIIAAPAVAQKRYLWTGGKLRCLPHSFSSFLSSPYCWPLVPAFLREYFVAPCAGEDESIESFAKRRLGNYVAETFLDPMVLGIYGGDKSQLSVRSCFRTLWDLEQESGSLIRGILKEKGAPEHQPEWMQRIQDAGLFSFKHGMQQLSDALATDLKASIRLNSGAISLRAIDGKWIVGTADGLLDADYVVSSLPPAELKRLVPSLDTEAVASLTVVNLAWHSPVLEQEGFGHLVPSKEGEAILGIVWDSCVFPQQNRPEQTRLTVMLRGVWEEKEGISEAQTAIRRHLGINQVPDCCKLVCARDAIPQYQVGHHRFIETQRKKAHSLGAPLSLIGSAYDGVGVNDCIKAARDLASDIGTRLHQGMRSPVL